MRLVQIDLDVKDELSEKKVDRKRRTECNIDEKERRKSGDTKRRRRKEKEMKEDRFAQHMHALHHFWACGQQSAKNRRVALSLSLGFFICRFSLNSAHCLCFYFYPLNFFVSFLCFFFVSASATNSFFALKVIHSSFCIPEMMHFKYSLGSFSFFLSQTFVWFLSPRPILLILFNELFLLPILPFCDSLIIIMRTGWKEKIGRHCHLSSSTWNWSILIRHSLTGHI